MTTRERFFGGLVVTVAIALLGCAEPTREVAMEPCPDPEGPRLETPARQPCDDERLTSYDSLLVVAPHPDDEMLAFAGLVDAYMRQGKPVEVIVATDGDAYCEACQLWKNGSTEGPLCDAAELSNFATEATDSLAEVRRAESTEAAAVLGREAPEFLGYPDTGLAAAWTNLEKGESDAPLYRSDFSGCEACGTCSAGYGGGPEIELSATTLADTLAAHLEATSENALVATTHWLDGHGDHAALGSFVRELNAELDAPRALAFGVIHAHTPKDTSHPDCWYPAPRAVVCPCAREECAEQDPDWVATLRSHRFRPDWPAALPDDADYGEPTQLCLPEAMWAGKEAIKKRAVEAYASQLGFARRDGELAPEIAGILDCNGYLISFVRATEAFVLHEPDV